MKRISVLLISLMLTLLSEAQTVTLKIIEGLENQPDLKAKVEKEISKLLTEFNNAAQNNRGLNLSGINMTNNSKEEIKKMYDLLPFACNDPVYSERCIETVTGYCIRGILVNLKPQPSYTNELERELTISFSADGTITKVVFSFNAHMTSLSKAVEVKDIARRNTILNFMETYSSWFETKDWGC